MTETTVTYHRDGYGPGRPAINVKYYGRLWADTDYDRIMRRLGDNPTIGEDQAGRMAEYAYDQVAAAFWSDAADQARWLNLGAIVQEGRSGGWLVFDDGYDPDEDYPDGDSDADLAASAERQQRWLANYRAMVQWCRETMARVPGDVVAILEAMATEGAVTP